MQSKPRPRGAQKASLRELELNVPPEASWHREYRGSAYVYVGGLHFGLTEGDVLAVFAQESQSEKRRSPIPFPPQKQRRIIFPAMPMKR
eukprot:jgi/Pico_ML_1/51518/g2539.t1